jgi:subtilase family serine protease
VVDRHLADIVSASWSDEAGDVLDDTGLRTSVGNTLLMAASTGVSVVFASGDDGDEYANTGRVAPDFPPSSPWATAVGGTTLELGFGVRQLGWSTTINRWLAPLFDTGPGRGGSGGGTSYQYSQPAYQIGVVPAALATRNGPTPMRVEPDISMDGDPGTGFLEGLTETTPTGVRYGQFAEGGTSLSAPLFAGLVALADQAHRGSLGFLNPALYSLDRADPAAIYDVGAMSGQAQSQISYDNNFDASGGYDDATRIDDYQGTEAHCVANLGCTSRTISLSAGTGYDDMTGLGTPASGFVPALARL